MFQIAPGLQFKRESLSTSGKFSGYASIFDGIDSVGDAVARGAFRKSLAAWAQLGKRPPMLLQHGGLMFGGTAMDLVPIGRWTRMEEDSKGLAVEGELFGITTERGAQIAEAMRAGELDGVSIGYVATGVRFASRKGEPERTLTEVDLREVSLVTFPADNGARVEQIKATTPRAFERQLHTLGYSRKQSREICALAWPAIAKSLDIEPPDFGPAADLLRSLTDQLKFRGE